MPPGRGGKCKAVFLIFYSRAGDFGVVLFNIRQFLNGIGLGFRAVIHLVLLLVARNYVMAGNVLYIVVDAVLIEKEFMVFG